MADSRSMDRGQDKNAALPPTSPVTPQPSTGFRYASLLGVACLSLALLPLSGCKKKDEAAPATEASSSAAAPAAGDNAVGSLEQAQMPEECSEQGKAAGHFATARDKGTSLDEVLSGIEKSTLDAATKEAQSNIARQIFNDPFARKLGAENASNNFSMACLADLQKKNSGQQTQTMKADIDKSLSLFKTFNGSSLTDLLNQYGVTIQSLQITQAKGGSNGLKDGDVLYTMSIAGSPPANMPCNLQKWVKGDIPPTPEFVQRGPAFPLLRSQEDDPLIYWAASGKCSPTHF